MICFGMVTTARSRHYTGPALASFFRHTVMATDDRFLLIDNDGDFEMPDGFSRVELIRRDRPRRFASNVNFAIEQASHSNADVVFLNNDIVFTPGWLAPLMNGNTAILVPISNQQVPYQRGGLNLHFTMDWVDYAGREDELSAIVKDHQANPQFCGRYVSVLHLSFFCFRLPRQIYGAVGLFDEGFGIGGGEDIDYRIRAHLAGFGVGMAAESYLLHFMGKSTWRGGETIEQMKARDSVYQLYFRAKWGSDLANIFLFGPDSMKHTAALGLDNMIKTGDFRGLICCCLARRSALEAAAPATSLMGRVG